MPSLVVMYSQSFAVHVFEHFLVCLPFMRALVHFPACCCAHSDILRYCTRTVPHISGRACSNTKKAGFACQKHHYGCQTSAKQRYTLAFTEQTMSSSVAEDTLYTCSTGVCHGAIGPDSIILHHGCVKAIYPSLAISKRLPDGSCLAPELLAGKSHSLETDPYAVGSVSGL